MNQCLKCKSKLKNTHKSKIINATKTECIRFIKIYYCKKCNEYMDIEK